MSTTLPATRGSVEAIVVEKTARGTYAYVIVAVMIVDVDREPEQPRMISVRAKSVREIVWVSGRVSKGKTARSASGRALIEAADIAAEWNRRR